MAKSEYNRFYFQNQMFRSLYPEQHTKYPVYQLGSYLEAKIKK